MQAFKGGYLSSFYHFTRIACGRLCELIHQRKSTESLSLQGESHPMRLQHAQKGLRQQASAKHVETVAGVCDPTIPIQWSLYELHFAFLFSLPKLCRPALFVWGCCSWLQIVKMWGGSCDQIKTLPLSVYFVQNLRFQPHTYFWQNEPWAQCRFVLNPKWQASVNRCLMSDTSPLKLSTIEQQENVARVGHRYGNIYASGNAVLHLGDTHRQDEKGRLENDAEERARQNQGKIRVHALKN